MPGQLIMYTTQWCGFCRNLKKQLARDPDDLACLDSDKRTERLRMVLMLLPHETVIGPGGLSQGGDGSSLGVVVRRELADDAALHQSGRQYTARSDGLLAFRDYHRRDGVRG